MGRAYVTTRNITGSNNNTKEGQQVARSPHPPNDFANYEFSVDITLRRETGSYNSDKLADVKVNETIPLNSNHDVISTLQRIVTETCDKALRSAGLRQEFELNMRALEAGNTIDA